MLPLDDRRGRRSGRARRRVDLAPPERLEGRELLAYTPLGVSLPDLTVSGFSGPVLAYSVPATGTAPGVAASLTVTVDVRNLGASSLTEPFNLAPGDPSNADAPPSTVGVFLAPRPGVRGRLIGTIAVPAVPQNSIVRVGATLPVPSRAELGRQFPAGEGTIFVNFQADFGRVVQEIDERNNRTGDGVPVRVALPLPDLEAVALDLPPALRPGDTIQPVFKVGNFGTVPTNTQGPVQVFLVASQDPFFGPGDAILSAFAIPNIPALSQAPTRRAVLGDVNVVDPPNIVTLTSPVVTLPTSPQSYFLGLAIDPNDMIREITEVDLGPDPRLQLAQFVSGTPADPATSGVISAPSSPANVFPIPAFGPIFTIAPVAGLPRASGQVVVPIAPILDDPGPDPIFSTTSSASGSGIRRRPRRARR